MDGHSLAMSKKGHCMKFSHIQNPYPLRNSISSEFDVIFHESAGRKGDWIQPLK